MYEYIRLSIGKTKTNPARIIVKIFPIVKINPKLCSLIVANNNQIATNGVVAINIAMDKYLTIDDIFCTKSQIVKFFCIKNPLFSSSFLSPVVSPIFVMNL